MSSDSSAVKPQELFDCKMIKSLSMANFSPDQRMVEEALGQSTQQGGNCEHRSSVPFGSFQFGRSGSPVPTGQFHRNPIK